MRHSELIIERGGIKVWSEKLVMPYSRIAAWKHQDSIPGKYWKQVQDAGLSTFDELAEAASTEATSNESL